MHPESKAHHGRTFAGCMDVVGVVLLLVRNARVYPGSQSMHTFDGTVSTEHHFTFTMASRFCLTLANNARRDSPDPGPFQLGCHTH